MVDPKTPAAAPNLNEAIAVVERIASHLDDLAARYLAYAGSDDNWGNRAAEEAKSRDAVRTVLTALASHAERIKELEGERDGWCKAAVEQQKRAKVATPSAASPVHVAQSVEPAAHNSLVAGSSPAVDTTPPHAPSMPADLIERAAKIIAPSAFAETRSRVDGSPTGTLKYADREANRDRARRKARDVLALVPFADRVAGKEGKRPIREDKVGGHCPDCGRPITPVGGCDCTAPPSAVAEQTEGEG